MGDRGGMSAAACRLSVEAVVMEYRDQRQEPPAGVPRKVLVMDDDRMFCEMAAELLQYLGCELVETCLLYTSPSPRDRTRSRMPSSA